jgi:hypothetical protein
MQPVFAREAIAHVLVDLLEEIIVVFEARAKQISTLLATFRHRILVARSGILH